MHKRTVTFIKIPSFPIAVERVVSRTLLQRPVVISQGASARNLCLAVSDEAAAMGIRIGMPLSKARRFCRDLTMMQPNPQLYKRATQAIWKIASNYTPLGEPARPGQYYLDMTGSNRLFGGAMPATDMLKTRIISELRLPAEAGIATNKLVSRVATFGAHSGEVLEIEQGAEEPFIAPFSVRILPSSEKRVSQNLSDLNIEIVRQIREIQLEVLLAAVGPPAFSLYRHARGIDFSPISAPSESPRITLNEAFSEDSIDPEFMEMKIQRMTIEAVFRLELSKRIARTLTLKLTYSDGNVAVRRCKTMFDQNTYSHWIERTLRLFRQTFKRMVRVRNIEMIFSQFSQSHEQLSLWSASVPNPKGMEQTDSSKPLINSQRMNRALQAVSKLQDRFGKESLKVGV
jgi:DNA polymerase-4